MLHNNLSTAIVLTGAPRTWNFCKDYIVQFVLDVYGKDCDWYICLHKSSTVDVNEIRQYLEEKEQNIVYLETVRVTKEIEYRYRDPHLKHDSWNNSNSFFNPGFFLLYKAGFEKRLHEFKTGKQYHRVFFARPDVLYLYNSKTVFLENDFSTLKDFSFHFKGHFDDRYIPFLAPSAGDLVLSGGVFAADLFMNWNLDYQVNPEINKISFRRNADIHSGLSEYFRKHLISTHPRPLKFPIVCEVVRPTQIYYKSEILKFFTENFNNFDIDQWPRDYGPGDCKFFKDREYTNRLNYISQACQALGIDIKDYPNK